LKIKYIHLSNKSKIEKYYIGHILNQKICYECLNYFLSIEEFISIPLYIPNFCSIVDIYEMIDLNFKEMEAKFYCDSCNKKTHGKLTKAFLNTPKILIFNLNNIDKNLKNINSPYELNSENNIIDLSKYMQNKKIKKKFSLYGSISHYGCKNFGHYIS
jgi:ubiquitin C-terminal hydrolase